MISEADVIKRLEFRQWRALAKVSVYFLDNKQYPCYRASRYFANKEEAEEYHSDEIRLVVSDNFINCVKIPLYCETIYQMEKENRINILDIYNKTV